MPGAVRRAASTPILSVAFAAFLLLGGSALAQNRAHSRRSEARLEVEKLLSGANPNATLARLKYLGEEPYAYTLLARVWPELTQEAPRRNVAEVISGLEVKAAEPFLARLCADEDGVLRMHGAAGLGRLRSKQRTVIEPLLADSSWAVRREAARALGRSRDKRASKALLAAAKAEGEPEPRQAMLIAAGQVGDKRAAKALAEFLEHSSESTRFAAARGLVLLRASEGYTYAGKLLAAEDRFVRRQGVALFEGVPATVAKKHLEPMLQDPDKRVAASAARTLYQGGDISRLEWLVLASYLANADDKVHFERELETLMLTDDKRRAILKKAGVP